MLLRELFGLPAAVTVRSFSLFAFKRLNSPADKLSSPQQALNPHDTSEDRSLLGIFFDGTSTLSSTKSPVITVNQTTLANRHTLRPEHIRATFEALGQEPPNANVPGWSQSVFRRVLPTFSDALSFSPVTLDGPSIPFGASTGSCEIDLRLCFGSFWPNHFRQSDDVDASEIFKRVAFGQPACGDCRSSLPPPSPSSSNTHSSPFLSQSSPSSSKPRVLLDSRNFSLPPRRPSPLLTPKPHYRLRTRCPSLISR